MEQEQEPIQRNTHRNYFYCGSYAWPQVSGVRRYSRSPYKETHKFIFTVVPHMHGRRCQEMQQKLAFGRTFPQPCSLCWSSVRLWNGCVCMRVRVCVCRYMCMWMCVRMRVYVFVGEGRRGCVVGGGYGCVAVCDWVWVGACEECVRLRVRLSLCVYVCMLDVGM